MNFFVIANFLSAQDYNFNNYKYRFQKLRGFSTYYNVNGNGINQKQKEKDTLYNDETTDQDKNNYFKLNFNCYYFKNINTEKLQHNSNIYSSIGFSNNNSYNKDNYNGPFSSNFQNLNNKSNNLNFSFNYSSNNRMYKANNSFKLLNYSLGTTMSSSNSIDERRYSSSSSDYYYNYKFKNYHFNANLEIGFGNGRLEYVTDPIFTAFMLKDLQAKAGVGVVTNSQIEAIAKGITTIRNTRFIDFRFRLIDQLEMLDSVLQANGIKSEKATRYFTTINDNWLYATQLGRFSGSRWSYYLDNSVYSSNNKNENDRKISNSLNTINTYFNRNIYNGIAINYDFSTQKNLNTQLSWGAYLNSGIEHRTTGDKFEDSIGTSGYKKTETKTKPDAIKSSIGGYFEYLWQPNTRTYLTMRISPYIASNRSVLSLRTANLTNSMSNSLEFGNSLNLGYFKFFNPRFYASVNANFNVRRNRTLSVQDQTTAPNPILTSRNINPNLYFYHQFEIGINYILF